MNAKDFNTLYDSLISNRLKEYDFTKKGNSLYHQLNGKQLAVIRRPYGNLRITNIIVCVRHCLLDDCTGKKIKYLSDPNEYPFKILPSELNLETVKKWHYSYRVFGKDGFFGEIINYGEDEKVWGKSTDIELELEQFYLKIKDQAREWFRKLNRECALNQLLLFNSGSERELKWIERYKNYNCNKVVDFPYSGNSVFKGCNLKKSNY